jgi:hypothetical protein
MRALSEDHVLKSRGPAVHGISMTQQRSPSFWRRASEHACWPCSVTAAPRTKWSCDVLQLLVAANLKIGIRLQSQRKEGAQRHTNAAHPPWQSWHAHCSPKEGQLSHDLLPVPRTRSPAPMPVSATAQQRECAVLRCALLYSALRCDVRSAIQL